MTPVIITNGQAAKNQMEALDTQRDHAMTYFYDAPRAVAMANEEGSYLVGGAVRQADADILLADLRHVAENMYMNDTTVIDCQPGGMTEAEVREAFRLAESKARISRNLLVVANLDLLIGRGSEEPTRLQQFAIDSLLKWTSPEEGETGFASRNVCATMRRPELATHPLRAKLVSSFAGKHSLAGSVHIVQTSSEEAPARIVSQAVAA